MMNAAFLQQIRQQAGKMAYSSVLYNWSLKSEPPTGLLFKPVDAWSGNRDTGRALTQGIFHLHGMEHRAHGAFWKPQGSQAALWMDYLHKFEWMRDLRALGGEDARFALRAYMGQWLRRFHFWDEETWHPARIGKRLSMWIALYDFYGDSADDDFQNAALDSMQRQARHLYRIMPVNLHGIEMLEALCGLITASLALPGGERWLDYALELLSLEVAQQILPDGGHITRRADILLQSVMMLHDVRHAMLAAGYPLPAAVQHAYDRAVPALRFFRYPDKYFGVFNGTQKGDDALLERVILQTGAKGRLPKSLSNSGYERLSSGRSMMMVDCGKAPPWPHDSAAHAAPGAFELSIGRERVFVSCGTHPLDDNWNSMLRGTAAHNALSLDYRNALEIRKNGHMGRKPKRVGVQRDESDLGQLLTIQHDGYLPINGILHQRRLFMNLSGDDIRGEDELITKTGTLTRPVAVHVRFHLHPRVTVSLVQDGTEALLLLPSGAGWRFCHEGAILSLENSIYLSNNMQPRKTKQLVLSVSMTEPEQTIQWALQKE